MNVAILRGSITKDIELKKLPTGSSAVNFYVAVRRDFKNTNNEYDCDFISCKAFGNTAEMISKYFHKGSGIIVEGRIQVGSYDGQDGKKVYTTDVIVNKVHFERGESTKKEEKPKEEPRTTNRLNNDPFEDFGSKIEVQERLPWE